MPPPTRAALYASFVRDLFYQGNNFNVHRPILKVVGKLPGLLLCDLLNRGCNPDSPTTPDGFFLCTHSYLPDWSKKEQETYFGKLKAAGLIEVRRTGSPAKRWVRIDVQRLATMVAVVRKPQKVAVPFGTASEVPNGGIQMPPQGGNWMPLQGGIIKTDNKKETLSGAPTPPPAAAATPDEEGDVFDGLIANYASPAPTKQQPAPQDYSHAQRLQSVLADRLNIRRRWSESKWADEFRKLRSDLADDEDRLSAALSWYCDHAGEEYVPEAFSASAFRSKFLAIEKQMTRANKRSAKEAPVTLSPAATKVLGFLANLKWPKGAEAQVAGVVQRSLDAHRELCLCVSGFTAPRHGVYARSLNGFHDRFKAQFGWGNEASAVAYVLRWMKRVHEEVWGWDEWGGDLTWFTFSPTHRYFVRDVEQLSVNYCGNTSAWEAYKKGVGL